RGAVHDRAGLKTGGCPAADRPLRQPRLADRGRRAAARLPTTHRRHHSQHRRRDHPMSPALANQVAIVTGASRGIGKATAHALANAGASVALAARDAARLEQLAGEIEAGGGTALSVPTDISNPNDVERMVARTVDAFGRLD